MAKQFSRKLEQVAVIYVGSGGTASVAIFFRVCSGEPKLSQGFLPVSISISMQPTLQTSASLDVPKFFTIYGAI